MGETARRGGENTRWTEGRRDAEDARGGEHTRWANEGETGKTGEIRRRVYEVGETARTRDPGWARWRAGETVPQRCGLGENLRC